MKKQCENCKHWKLDDVFFESPCDWGHCQLFSTQITSCKAVICSGTLTTRDNFCCSEFCQKVFSKRLNNLELRPFGLRPDKDTLEIVCWYGNICITIAYWVTEDSDYVALRFVYDKPFREHINSRDFWELAKVGQEYLDANK